MNTRALHTRCRLCGSRDLKTVRNQRNGWHVATCRDCNLTQIAPRPTSVAVTRLYRDDWDHFAPYLSAADAHRAYFRRILGMLGASPGTGRKSLLDVGCATGELLAEANAAGITAEGIDLSKSAVSYCQARGLRACVGRLDAAFAARHKHKRFDVITAFEVIEHEYDPSGFAQRAYRLLSSSGTMLVSTPDYGGMGRHVMGEGWVGWQHPEHLWFFTRATLARIFLEAGFTDIRVVRDPARPYTVCYAFRRLADYFPAAEGVFRIGERATRNLNIPVPVNPWGDMLLIAKKP